MATFNMQVGRVRIEGQPNNGGFKLFEGIKQSASYACLDYEEAYKRAVELNAEKNA